MCCKYDKKIMFKQGDTCCNNLFLKDPIHMGYFGVKFHWICPFNELFVINILFYIRHENSKFPYIFIIKQYFSIFLDIVMEGLKKSVYPYVSLTKL